MMIRLKMMSAAMMLVNTLAAQQPPAAIKGLIIDATSKKAMEAVTVSVSVKGNANPYGNTVSDPKGFFQLAIKDTGTYVVRLTAVGYKEQSLSITAGPNSGDLDLGNIAMLRGSGMLAEVVVRADKPLIEQKADRLVYNAEKDLSTMGGTAADVLRNVPMLSVDPNGNVQLRGSSNIRVLINNKPSSIIAVSVADALRQLPADAIKTVEVITSPGAKYDAEGTAGIINIITKKNMLQGVTGSVVIVPGNVSTIGNAGLNFRRPRYGLSFSSGINQFYNRGTTYLERLAFADNSTFLQEGKTRNRSGFVSPRLGFDYTFNDRNSISGGFGYNPSYNYVTNKQIITSRKPGVPDRISSRDLLNKTRVNGYDVNFEYVRSFKDPQKEFAFLVLHTITDADNIANQDEYDPSNELVYQQRNLNKSRNTETTLQTDYTHPLKNKSIIEVGAKTILRKASSHVDYLDVYPASGSELAADNIFYYKQDVLAGYLSYGFTLFKKVQVKAGGRYEKTLIHADYQTKNFAFSTDYDNLIPSLNAAYTFKKKHTLRIGYTQRLQRPQLYFLNPYREVLAPQIVQIGNPQLEPELSNTFDIGYGTYGKVGSFNASLWGRITENAITSVVNLENDTTYIRFFNIASNKTFGISLSGTVKPFKRWSLNSNVNLYHVQLQGQGRSNRGFMYNIFVGSNLELGKGWSHGFNGSFNSRRIDLQGKVWAFYYHNTFIRKEVWNKRGSIGINLANPFMRGTRQRNDRLTAAFLQREDHINYTRGIRIQLQYRFGSLQPAKTPKRPKKGINNDDALRNQ